MALHIDAFVVLLVAKSIFFLYLICPSATANSSRFLATKTRLRAVRDTMVAERVSNRRHGFPGTAASMLVAPRSPRARFHGQEQFHRAHKLDFLLASKRTNCYADSMLSARLLKFAFIDADAESEVIALLLPITWSVNFAHRQGRRLDISARRHRRSSDAPRPAQNPIS